jgi:hypothetical protein
MTNRSEDHTGAERPAGEFSPEKVHLDLRDREVSSVGDYVSAINGNWQRGVEAFMQIAPNGKA